MYDQLVLLIIISIEALKIFKQYPDMQFRQFFVKNLSISYNSIIKS